jgi:hypothetical protein
MSIDQLILPIVINDLKSKASSNPDYELTT